MGLCNLPQTLADQYQWCDWFPMKSGSAAETHRNYTRGRSIDAEATFQAIVGNSCAN